MKKERKSIRLWLLIAAAIVILPIFTVNMVLIIKGSIAPHVPPSVFGIIPLNATDTSMDGDEPDSYPEGSLIFVKELNAEDKQALERGDIVCFEDGGAYITHRIHAVVNYEGRITHLVTMGDKLDQPDEKISVDQVIGKYIGHTPVIGNLAELLSTPAGIGICLGVPILLYIIFDVVRITLKRKD